MDQNLRLKIEKRRQEMYDYYYRSMGEKIKRTRIEKDLTQEVLAKGICSNTYISKIENNKIAANKEQLFLLMERMGIETDKIGFPEMMVESLELSYEYFFYRDVESYQKLMEKLDIYDYGVLIFVVRLGYHVLTEDYVQAKLIYDDMYRYLDTLEEYGFAIFMIYGCFYNVGIHDYRSARMILETLGDKMRTSEFLYALYHYLRFIIYGRLHNFNQSKEAMVIVTQLFIVHNNTKRIAELMMYSTMFKIYENAECISLKRHDFLLNLTATQKNAYLIMISEVADNPLMYLSQLDVQGDYYLDGVFLKTLQYLKTEDKKNFEKYRKTLNDLHYQYNAKIDYLHLLELIQNNDENQLKEYLINYILPYLDEYQHLYFYRKTSNWISDILQKKNQYKHALFYRMKPVELKRVLLGLNTK